MDIKAKLIAAVKDKYNSYITYLIYNYRDRELEKQNQPEAYTGEVEKALDMLYDIWEQ